MVVLFMLDYAFLFKRVDFPPNQSQSKNKRQAVGNVSRPQNSFDAQIQGSINTAGKRKTICLQSVMTADLTGLPSACR